MVNSIILNSIAMFFVIVRLSLVMFFIVVGLKLVLWLSVQGSKYYENVKLKLFTLKV